MISQDWECYWHGSGPLHSFPGHSCRRSFQELHWNGNQAFIIHYYSNSGIHHSFNCTHDSFFFIIFSDVYQLADLAHSNIFRTATFPAARKASSSPTPRAPRRPSPPRPPCSPCAEPCVASWDQRISSAIRRPKHSCEADGKKNGERMSKATNSY